VPIERGAEQKDGRHEDQGDSQEGCQIERRQADCRDPDTDDDVADAPAAECGASLEIVAVELGAGALQLVRRGRGATLVRCGSGPEKAGETIADRFRHRYRTSSPSNLSRRKSRKIPSPARRAFAAHMPAIGEIFPSRTRFCPTR